MQQAPASVELSDLAVFPKELLVTFQIALVGIDGLVVGSDRRSLHFSSPDEPSSEGAIQPDEVCKFIKSTDEDVICAHAGGPFSEVWARAIVTRCVPVKNDVDWK